MKCSCGVIDESTREDHKDGEANCTEKAICSVCDQAYGNVDSSKHNASNELSKNETHHWNDCTRCGEELNKTEHVYENNCDTDCACGNVRVAPHNYKTEYETDDGQHWIVCGDCGVEKPDTRDDHAYDDVCDTDCDCGYERTAPHNYKTEYETDDGQHWIVCGDCGAEKPDTRGDHAFENACDTDCECGYERTVTHDYSVTDYDDAQHWKKCSVCGEVDESAIADHEFDNACDTDCACGYERDVEPHDYSVTDYDDARHWLICSECGAVDESTIADHEFENACDTDCDCGYERSITHDYSVSEFDAVRHWKSCSVCGATNGRTSRHSFDNSCDTDCACGYTREITHTYDGECDVECNVCDEARTVEKAHVYDNTCDTKCNVCGEARATEHTYTNACDSACDVCYEVRTPAAHTGGTATCTKKAVCTICGREYGELAEHSYSAEWKNGASRHWHECSCGSKKDEAAHVFGDWIEKDGVRTKLCECGYTVTDLNYKTEKSLPTGAVIGIGIGPVAFVGVVGFGVCWFLFKKKK